MKTRLRRCPSCGRYTLKESCPLCGSQTHMPLPPRFSPEDKYGRYRRMLKKMARGGGDGADTRQVH